MDYLSASDLIHLNERVCRALGRRYTPPGEATEDRLTILVEKIQDADSSSLTDKAAGYLYGLLKADYFLVMPAATAVLTIRVFVMLNGGNFHKKLKRITVATQTIPAGDQGQEMWSDLVSEVQNDQIGLRGLQTWLANNVTPPKSPE